MHIAFSTQYANFEPSIFNSEVYICISHVHSFIFNVSMGFRYLKAAFGFSELSELKRVIAEIVFDFTNVRYVYKTLS